MSLGRSHSAWLSFILPMVIIVFLAFPGLSQAESEKSLYERLGGYDAISAVVDRFLEKVWNDPEISRFFIGMGTDTRNQLRQKNKNLMCHDTGGPCKIISRPLEVAHAGLGITEKEFNIVVNHLASTLKEFKVPKPEHEELMAKVRKLKPYIVETKAKD